MTRRRSIPIPTTPPEHVVPAPDNCGWQAREAEKVNNSMFTYWVSICLIQVYA